jgi:hypothetical protein
MDIGCKRWRRLHGNYSTNSAGGVRIWLCHIERFMSWYVVFSLACLCCHFGWSMN